MFSFDRTRFRITFSPSLEGGSGGRRPKGKPNHVDVAVGRRIRMRRRALGITQSALGEGLGVSFQQVQKYEKGANRVAAGRLRDIANLLRVPMTFLFEDVDPTAADDLRGVDFSGSLAPSFSEAADDPSAYASPDAVQGLRMHRAFSAISSPKMRSALVALATAIAVETSSASLKRSRTPKIGRIPDSIRNPNGSGAVKRSRKVSRRPKKRP